MMDERIKVTYRKGDGRYYVSIDGEKVGWVCRFSGDKEWNFYACVNEALKGKRLATSDTRRDAVMDGISSLEIYHSGYIARLNMDTVKDEWFQFEPAKLRRLWQQFLNDKYPEAAS